MPRSKRKIATTVVSKTGVELQTCYCRKCMQNKKPIEFYDSVDLLLDANGKMSVCKDCCNELFNTIQKTEKSMEKALLISCRLLNIKFEPAALNAALAHIEKKLETTGQEIKGIFGMYKAKLTVIQKTSLTDRATSIDLTFVEPTVFVPSDTESKYEEITDLRQIWGDKLSDDDYDFLEREYSEWCRTHPSDTKSEQILLREICLKTLDIRKAREQTHPTATLVKELQEIMKTASVDPGKVSAMNSGKSQETFANIIKIIEQNEPADYYKDKELFKDFDNIHFYFMKYIVRPLKNFITGSRDFNVGEDENDENEEQFFEDGEFNINQVINSSENG